MRVFQQKWEVERFLSNYQTYQVTLAVIFKWDEAAVAEFCKEICKVRKQITFGTPEYFSKMQQLFLESKQVGSTMYFKLLRASRYSAKEKLETVISTHLGAKLDNFSFLQIANNQPFPRKLPPHAPFFAYIAHLVQQAYATTGLTNPLVHQFRMYIDRHNINYIRRYYQRNGESDEEALRAYARRELASGHLLLEPARLHNKFPKYSSFYQYSGCRWQIKRLTPDFHSEFILDADGNFVTQWDGLVTRLDQTIVSDYQYYVTHLTEEAWHQFQKCIVNGESFNYANRNDRVHYQLDIQPVSAYDPLIRQVIRRGNASQQLPGWKSPSLHVSQLFKGNFYPTAFFSIGSFFLKRFTKRNR